MKKLELTPGSIVVGVDGSDHALRAVELAAAEAELEGRPLAVIHARSVVDSRYMSWAGYYGAIPVPPEPDEHAGAMVADAVAVATKRHPGLSVTGHTVVGEAREVLHRASRTADLIVVGSRGSGPVRSALLGSVSATVAEHADCPVIVSRPIHSGAVKDGVVVAVDLTPESIPVIEYAYEYSSRHRLPLTVLHFLEDDPALTLHGIGPEPGSRQRLLSESLAGFTERYPDVNVTRRVERGQIDVGLTKGRPRPWHLIVVGRHVDEHGLARWFCGSNATAVLERAGSPVAVVPQAGARPRHTNSTAAGQRA